MLVLWIAALSLLLAACDEQPVEPPERTAIAELLTLQPEMVLTLTAWPTSPPILTLAPTPSAAPQALWTAEPEETLASTDEPVPTPATPVPSPGTIAPSSQINPAALGSGSRPSQLRIPDIGLDVPVVEVSWEVAFEAGTWHSRWQTVDDAAGHHRDSANPGEGGNVVLSGHHNTGAEVFRQVSEIGLPGSPLGEGIDLILVAADGGLHTYTVVSWERFQVEGIPETERRNYAHYMDPTTDPILTLITCWPYESNSHRVVVVAELQPAE